MRHIIIALLLFIGVFSFAKKISLIKELKQSELLAPGFGQDYTINARVVSFVMDDGRKISQDDEVYIGEPAWNDIDDSKSENFSLISNGTQVGSLLKKEKNLNSEYSGLPVRVTKIWLINMMKTTQLMMQVEPVDKADIPFKFLSITGLDKALEVGEIILD